MDSGGEFATFDLKKLRNLQILRKKAVIGKVYILYKKIKLCYNFCIMILSADLSTFIE